MKQRLVGTAIGHGLIRARSLLDLRRIPFANPEQAALVANHILADRLIVGLCAGQDSFLDIGAHIGSVLAAVHRAHPGVAIRAIEADPVKAAALVRRFPYCEVTQAAVGETHGTAQFYLHDGRPGYNSLANRDGATRQVTVGLRRLDDLFPETHVDVVKIDIEGAELGALRGGAGLLARARPVVMFESSGTGENELGYSAAQLWAFLDDHGFDVVTPARLAHDAPALSLDAFLDAHHYPMQSINFFAAPREKRIALRDRARRVLGIEA